jgi:3-(3-hydroxy-phenyl)propionate hydroxylase
VRSSIRGRLGLPFEGRTFADRFLIADIRMKGNRANERLFWFAPHFYDGQSALMHRQPDDVWRIDLQLDADADPKREQSPEVVVPRLERMLGHRDFELVWTSVYQYQCRRLERFVHGRVIFVGDAAHQVTPFGARGANSGIQDAENLSWKLALVIRDLAEPRLIESYDTERSAAADENIAHSSNAADFVVPRSVGERRLRDAVLELARTENFAQRMVNSGRASTAAAYDSPLSTPDTDEWTGNLAPGAMIPDAPLRNGNGQPVWLAELMGRDFNLLTFAAGDLPDLPPGLNRLDVGRDIEDGEGLVQTRFDATPGCGYLVRPDMHLAARWRDVARAPVATALARATGAEMGTP